MSTPMSPPQPGSAATGPSITAGREESPPAPYGIFGRAVRYHGAPPELGGRVTLETERLWLRPWEEADAENLYRYAKDPTVGGRGDLGLGARPLPGNHLHVHL